ncbi:MAG: archaeosortase A, partial [Thermoplasmata archaeon]|nr:archaeosortase A [Thermoplasmata archaeon]
IYVLNLFRNWSIIYMIDTLGMSPQTAHDIIGKAGSLAALFLLALMTFRLLPELLDDLEKVLDLFIPRKQR